MEPIQPNYPERLFIQPDFSVLFKFFQRDMWPRNDPGQFDKMWAKGNLPIIGGDYLDRKNFWDALNIPYKLILIENEEGLFTSSYPKQDEKAPHKFETYEALTRFIEDDFRACELFAIHWWLKNYFVKTQINPLRKKPKLSPDQLKHFSKFEDIRIQVSKNNISSFEKTKRDLKKILNSPVSSNEEKDRVGRLIEEIKHWEIKESKIKRERTIRRDISKLIYQFLEQVIQPNSKEGIYAIGAFLIFSSGLSYTGTTDKVQTEWDKYNMPDNFKMDINRN
jgi:hypothetical protein